jgi:hypothetical protein
METQARVGSVKFAYFTTFAAPSVAHLVHDDNIKNTQFMMAGEIFI